MEIFVAILGPLFGGAISLVVWQAKQNSDSIHNSLGELHSCVHDMDKKIDVMSVDNVKNFATKQELIQHEEREESRDEKVREEIKEIRSDIKEIKETQWKMILDKNKSI
jgi:hypothetical protein